MIAIVETESQANELLYAVCQRAYGHRGTLCQLCEHQYL
jgi:hypothetical protein